MLQFFKLTNINFVKIKYPFMLLSLVLVISSIVIFTIKGDGKFGIDFAGGQIQEYSFDKPIAVEDMRVSLKNGGVVDASIQQFKDNPNAVLIRTSQDTATAVQEQFKKDFSYNNFQILRIENVGPVVGKQLKAKALWAIAWSLLSILLYVAFRFKHFDFALGGIVALIHDVIVATGILLFFGKQIDLLVVSALLTLAGFSINDTIVVYDRIRELMQKMHKATLIDVINAAINQTLSRTILTSLTTTLVVISLFMFGGEVLNSFALVLLVGFIVGSYSTIFIATPIVVAFRGKPKK